MRSSSGGRRSWGAQLAIGLDGVDTSKVVIAYEPVWSIGPGKNTGGPFLYSEDRGVCQGEKTGGMDVVYGGGLKQDNAAMLSSIPEIDGGLIALTPLCWRNRLLSSGISGNHQAIHGRSKSIMNLEFEYGQGLIERIIAGQYRYFYPRGGQGWPIRPIFLKISLRKLIWKVFPHPVGMPTLTELAHKGSTVCIVVPDRVKGGEQPTSHRKLSIKYILRELYAAGVEKKDILLIISNGLHPRSKESDAKAIFGAELFDEFWHTGQIISHDSEDSEHRVDLGVTGRGDPVFMNRYVFECDIPILIGHVQGNPYGGYSGGYKHSATGITNWREYRQPSCAVGHAPGRLYAGQRRQPDAHEV